MPLRVLHVVPTLEHGAVTTRVATLCEHALSDGIEAHVAALRGGGARNRVRGVASVVHDLRERRACDPFVLRRLRGVIHRARAEVVHAWGLAASAYAAAVAPRSRLVVSWDPSSEGAPLWRSRAVRWTFNRRPRVLCDGAIPDTEITGIWKDATHVPRATATAAPNTERLAETYGFPVGAPVIGVVSRLEPRKGVRELLWAADLVRVAHPDACFLVIGDGPERAALKRFTRMACDPSRIRLAGPRDDAQAVVAQLDLLWHAGDELSPPLALLEAMAAGVPAVADDTRGARAAVADGESGCLVRDGERAQRARATLRLLSDAELRGGFAHAGRERAERDFSLGPMLEAYRKAYEEVAEVGARSR